MNSSDKFVFVTSFAFGPLISLYDVKKQSYWIRIGGGMGRVRPWRNSCLAKFDNTALVLK
jgi:hypothetical protein